MQHISGLTYKEDVISIEKEKELIEYIDSQEFSNALKRRVQHYGYVYSYTNKNISDEKAQPIPELFSKLVSDLKLDNVNQIIVNEYTPGQGISSHIDNRIFGKQIATLSLLSGITMDFKSRNMTTSMYLKPRSLVILENEARYVYTHGIANRKSDMVNGEKIMRKRRVSITFRYLKNAN